MRKTLVISGVKSTFTVTTQPQQMGQHGTWKKDGHTEKMEVQHQPLTVLTTGISRKKNLV